MAIDNSRWRFVVTDLNGNMAAPGTGVVFNARNRQYSRHLNAGRTCQFTLDIDNPSANYVLSNNALVKFYRKTLVSGTWQLLMVGDIINVEEDGQGDIGTVTLVAADPFWRLQRRLLATDVDTYGRGIGLTVGSAASPMDIGTIILYLLSVLNSAGYTGIAVGTSTPTTTGYVGPLYLQSAGDIFQQLCSTLGGPNLIITPVEPAGAMPNTQIAVMSAQIQGAFRPNAVFEYGTGQLNVDSYSRVLSRDGFANQLFSPQQGYPDLPGSGDTFVSAADIANIAANGLFQDVVQSDLASGFLRQALVNEHLSIRKVARQQITITPSINSSLDYIVDYNDGDTVTVRAMVNGAYRFNGTARIYGTDLSIGESDEESVNLTLIPGG